MNLKCHDCGKEITDKEGVWAYHDDLPPKTDLSIHANCWLVNRDTKLHYNGNLDSDDYSTYPRLYVNEVTIWATTPIRYKKDDLEFIQIAPPQKDKDKKDGYDRFQILGIIAEHLGDIKEE